jgi:hypothetical protein
VPEPSATPWHGPGEIGDPRFPNGVGHDRTTHRTDDPRSADVPLDDDVHGPIGEDTKRVRRLDLPEALDVLCELARRGAFSIPHRAIIGWALAASPHSSLPSLREQKSSKAGVVSLERGRPRV